MTARWLGKNHRAIAVDLPGYGLSDKPLDINYDFAFYTEVLSGFLDALGVEEGKIRPTLPEDPKIRPTLP